MRELPKLLVLVAVSVFAVVGGEVAAIDFTQGQDGALITGDVTVQTTWQLPPEPKKLLSTDLLWLGFGSAPDHDLAATEIAIVWWQDTSSFFPVGKVSLFGQPDVLPTDSKLVEYGNGIMRFDLATVTVPLASHVYEVSVSHRPATGTLGLRIYDTTQGREVVALAAGGVASDVRLGEPAAGTIIAGRALNTSVTTHPHFTPLGHRWFVRRIRSDGSVAYLAGQSSLVEAGDQLELELDMPIGPPGTWHVILESEGARTPLTDIKAGSGITTVPILTVPEDLVGLHHVVLQYEDDDHVVLRDSVPLVAGRIAVQMGPLLVEEGSAYVSVPLHVDSTFPVNFTLVVDPSLTEIVWDPNLLRYVEIPVVIDVDPIHLPVDLSATLQADMMLRVPTPSGAGTFKLHNHISHDIRQKIAFQVDGEGAVFTMGNPVTEFKVVTYNIWATVQWPQRESALRAIVHAMQPDILALQELRPQTLMVLDELLPGHERVRDPFRGWVYESNIFWSAKMFDLVEYGAEDIGIYETWRRLFWVRLRVKDRDRTILVSTAHYTWDGHERVKAEGGKPRLDMAQRTVEVLQRLTQPDEPVIFMGDLNESGAAIDILRNGGLRDSVGVKGEPLQYTHPADPTMTSTRSILDWQLHMGPIRAKDSQVVGFLHDGVAPSDHKPVMVTYELE